MKILKKSKIALSILAFVISLGVLNSLNQTIQAAGCYKTPSTVNQTACNVTGNTNDTQGNVVNTASNCYLVGTSDGNMTYTKVDCSHIETPSNYCGGPGQAVSTSIDLGCSHQGNPITDVLFAIIRLLSDGVGIAVIASIVVGGIQYTTSRGDPQAAATAIKRISSSAVALLIFIFGWALLQWLIPGGLFN